jgi:hypothetical protein
MMVIFEPFALRRYCSARNNGNQSGGSAQPEERKDEHDDHDQSDEVDDAVHDDSPVQICRRGTPATSLGSKDVGQYLINLAWNINARPLTP